MRSIAAILVFCLVAGVIAPASAASRMLAQAPDFNVTPLMKKDIDTYVGVLRAALERLKSAIGRERKALDFVREINEGAVSITPGPPSQIDASLVVRSAEFSNTLAILSRMDERVAEERGILDLYIAIRWAVRNRLGMPNGYSEQKPYCGRGGDCGSSPTPVQVILMTREKATRAADRDLVEGRRSELEAIIRQYERAVDIQWR
jgi:hypothetical protein